MDELVIFDKVRALKRLCGQQLSIVCQKGTNERDKKGQIRPINLIGWPMNLIGWPMNLIGWLMNLIGWLMNLIGWLMNLIGWPIKTIGWPIKFTGKNRSRLVARPSRGPV